MCGGGGGGWAACQRAERCIRGQKVHQAAGAALVAPLAEQVLTAPAHLRRLNTGAATPAPRQRCARRKQPSKRATRAGARAPSLAGSATCTSAAQSSQQASLCQTQPSHNPFPSMAQRRTAPILVCKPVLPERATNHPLLSRPGVPSTRAKSPGVPRQPRSRARTCHPVFPSFQMQRTICSAYSILVGAREAGQRQPHLSRANSATREQQ